MMIGARTAAWAKVGGGWVNPYVTDGLVAMWDGEWNAGGGAHVDSASSWKDLINCLELSKSQTLNFEDKCLIHNGGELSVVSEIVKNLAASAFTFQIVFKRNSINQVDASDGLVYMPEEGTSVWNKRILRIYSHEGLLPGYAIYRGTHSYIESEIRRMSAPVGVVNSHTYICEIGRFVGYSGKTKVVDFSSSLFSDTNSNGQFITGGTYTDGYDYSIRIYNRSMTADEIAANHEIDKARFVLT